MERLTNYSNGERLTLELPGLPTSANAIWRSCVAARGRKVYSYRSEEYRAWLRRVEAEILARGVRIPDDWPFVGVELILTPPNRRDVDVDNRFKALFDALTAAREAFGDCEVVVRDAFEDWRLRPVENVEAKPVFTVGADVLELEIR